MPYKSGQWGEQAKKRSSERLEYFKKYSKNPELVRKHSLGWMGEELASSLFKLPRVNMPGYDLEGKLNIEVKSSTPNKDGKWSFNISKTQQAESDCLALYCFSKQLEIERLFLAPRSFITGSTLRIPREESDYGIRLY